MVGAKPPEGNALRGDESCGSDAGIAEAVDQSIDLSAGLAEGAV